MKINLITSILCCTALSASAQVDSLRIDGNIHQPPVAAIEMHSRNGQTAFSIVVGDDGKYVVKLGPGMSNDEATREFWRMVKMVAPTACPTTSNVKIKHPKPGSSVCEGGYGENIVCMP